MRFVQQFTCLILVYYAVLLSCGAAEKEEGSAVKVGAYYFDGWTGKTDKWHLTKRLQGEFGYRQPIWGWVTSTPEIMDKQIAAAVDHDVRFFAFCWFHPEGKVKETPLNNALKLFLQARNPKKMEFCLLVANHAGFSIGPKEWDECCATWIKLFQNPLYVKANGKPLIIFHSPRELNRLFGGPQGVEKALTKLRKKAVAAGLPGVTIAGCWQAQDIRQHPKIFRDDLKAGYDLITGYSLPHFCARDWPKRDQKYEHLVDYHPKAWDLMTKTSKKPCLPVATVGWDMRPWEKADLPESKQTVRYPDISPEGIERLVRNGATWLRKNSSQTTKEKLLLLYAWNEYGEGGYLTPTKRDGYSYLQAVKRGIRSSEEQESVAQKKPTTGKQ